MSELPKCKLCNFEAAPIEDEFVDTFCVNAKCPAHNISCTADQWRTLMGEPEPNMFWDQQDGEHSSSDPHSLAELLDSYYLSAGEEAEFNIDCAYRLKDRRIKITAAPDEDGEMKWEWIE